MCVCVCVAFVVVVSFAAKVSYFSYFAVLKALSHYGLLPGRLSATGMSEGGAHGDVVAVVLGSSGIAASAFGINSQTPPTSPPSKAPRQLAVCPVPNPLTSPDSLVLLVTLLRTTNPPWRGVLARRLFDEAPRLELLVRSKIHNEGEGAE